MADVDNTQALATLERNDGTPVTIEGVHMAKVNGVLLADQVENGVQIATIKLGDAMNALKIEAHSSGEVISRANTKTDPETAKNFIADITKVLAKSQVTQDDVAALTSNYVAPRAKQDSRTADLPDF